MSTSPIAGPYDDAIKALGASINALTADLKALRDGHAPKSDLDSIRVELKESRDELAALKRERLESKKTIEKKREAPTDDSPADDDSCLSGFWE